MSKSQVSLGVIVVAGAAALLFFQHQTQQKLRAENESLQQEIAQLKSHNEEAPAATSKPASDDFNELLRLRGEVSALRAQTNQIAKLQQQNQQLQDSLTNALQARQQSAAQSAAQAEEQRAYSILQINTAKISVLGMIMYAADHGDAFPTNFTFDQADSYFGSNGYRTNLNAFEIVYHGALANVANPSAAIVVRSIQPWTANGKWAKAYGFADGHAEVHSVPDGNFDEWEQQHAAVLKNQ